MDLVEFSLRALLDGSYIQLLEGNSISGMFGDIDMYLCGTVPVVIVQLIKVSLFKVCWRLDTMDVFNLL